jgi:hypothetical protein
MHHDFSHFAHAGDANAGRAHRLQVRVFPGLIYALPVSLMMWAGLGALFVELSR